MGDGRALQARSTAKAASLKARACTSCRSIPSIRIACSERLQAGTSHNLGDNFARAFETQFLDESGEQVQRPACPTDTPLPCCCS